MGAQKLVEIATLRDDAALALTDLREVGVRRVAVAEPDSLGWLLRGSAGAGGGLPPLCTGTITLWSRSSPPEGGLSLPSRPSLEPVHSSIDVARFSREGGRL
jgi:hypothetical protein